MRFLNWGIFPSYMLRAAIMKFVQPHPFANPDAAARKLVEIANDVEAVQDGRIYIERVNEPFLAAGGSGDDFRAGSMRAPAAWSSEQTLYFTVRPKSWQRLRTATACPPSTQANLL